VNVSDYLLGSDLLSSPAGEEGDASEVPSAEDAQEAEAAAEVPPEGEGADQDMQAAISDVLSAPSGGGEESPYAVDQSMPAPADVMDMDRPPPPEEGPPLDGGAPLDDQGPPADDGGGDAPPGGGGGGGGSGDGGGASAPPAPSSPSVPPPPPSSGPAPADAPDTTAADAAAAENQARVDQSVQDWLDANGALLDHWDEVYAASLDADGDMDMGRVPKDLIDRQKAIAADVLAKYNASLAAQAETGLAPTEIVSGDLDEILGEMLGVAPKKPLHVTKGKVKAPEKKKAEPPSPKKKADAALLAKAHDLHKRTAKIHAQSKALQTDVKSRGKPMTAAQKALGKRLTGERSRLRSERTSLRSSLSKITGKKPTAPAAPPPPPLKAPASALAKKPAVAAPSKAPGAVLAKKPAHAAVPGAKSATAPAGRRPVAAPPGRPGMRRVAIRGDAPLMFVLPSPLHEVSGEDWTRFVLTMRTADTGSVSPSNALGASELKPRRLADLDMVMNLSSTRDQKSGRMVWIGEFVPPLSSEFFLSSPRIQYGAFCKSMKAYADGMKDGEIPEPDGGCPRDMTLSGALAVLHRCGPSGIRTWNDEERRFPETVALFDDVNGIF
jgi:hypothetical protein